MRSKWKGPYISNSLFRWIKSDKKLLSKSKKIWCRRATILPCFIGFEFLVYNGHQFKKVKVKSEIVNFKFGEFAPTRRIKRRKH